MILVTGATGLSGGYTVKYLRQNGLAVRAFVREASAPAAEALDAEIAIGDLADPDSLRRACQGVKGIVHAACTFTDSTIDIGAMQTLLKGWKEAPLVFFSSLDVYGRYPKVPLISESEPLDGTWNDYAHGKVVCEKLLLEKAEEQGHLDEVSILRAPHILTPHPKVYEKLIGLLGDRGPVVLPGASEAEWSRFGDAYIDARDLAWIVGACLRRPIVGPLNVLAGHFAWHDVYEEVIRLTGKDLRNVHIPFDSIPEHLSDFEKATLIYFSQSWRFDDYRLRAALNFQPTRTWQQTVAETIRWGLGSHQAATLER